MSITELGRVDHRLAQARGHRIPWNVSAVVITGMLVLTSCASPTATTSNSGVSQAPGASTSTSSDSAVATPMSASPTSTAPLPAGPPTTPTSGTALAALNGLRVAGRGPMTGYSRALFGPAWTDTDRNGCDTRNDILRRDLTNRTVKAGTGGCVVLTGTLHDPYSGTAINFGRGTTTSALVQIDHVVALGNAWVTGAASWPYAKKIAFANDPLNLLAVKGSLNEQKGDGDAATWLPPNKPFRCAYVARQVSVKAKYGLYVTSAEKTAIQQILVTCPSQPLLTGGNPTTSTVLPPIAASSTASPKVTTTSPPPATAGSVDPRFATCKAAKAAGYGPYYRGKDPEYAWYRDADGDGIVCE